MRLHPDTLHFLRALKDNNTKEWFAENKSRYDAIKANFLAFSQEITSRLTTTDVIEDTKVYRIYANNRFQKPPFPYKTNLGCSLKRATKWRRGGYYLHIEPDNSFVGGGFWSPSPEDLARMRAEIAASTDEFREILADADFVQNFGSLQGKQLKTAPKGYAKDDAAADLLRLQQYLLMRPLSNEQVMSEQLVDLVDETFRAMRPFLDFMSDALTTDLNGETLS